MNDHLREALTTTADEHAPEEDMLMSRMIDGLATGADRDRFEELADEKLSLWRELVCRQQDMNGLRDQVALATAGAASIDLPRRWFAPPRISWTMALSGWAAVLIVMVSWAALALSPRPGGHTTTERVTDVRTPEDHFSAYLGAPYVLGDMEPIVLGVDDVGDGRVAVRFLRQIEEVLFVDPDGELPVDETGELLRDLKEFRQRSARNQQSAAELYSPRMSKKRDYYEVLGVSHSAGADEIRKAYRALARKWHPDVNKEPDAANRFGELTEAYEVLNDPEKRKAYDRFGMAGVGAGAGGPRGASWGGPGASVNVDVGDLGSLFDEMFGGRQSPFGHAGGRGDPFGGRGPRPPRPARGRDIEHTISVTFLTAARGGTERVRLDIGGSVRTIDVKIPPAIEPGAKLRIRGSGQPGGQGGAAGDVIITVEVGDHPFFRRDGLDLLVDVPISLAEAGLGASVRVPLLDGSAEIKIPPGTGSGRKLRLRGKGLVDASGKTGDFLAVVQIAAPGELSERARAALGTLAEELQDPRDSGPWQ